MTKYILITLILCFSCRKKEVFQEEKFSVEIWDFDSSMSQTAHYIFNNERFILELESGLESEKDEILILKKIDSKGRSKIIEALKYLNFEKLKSNYSDPSILDGEEKIIEISFEGIKKEIQISNVYVKEINVFINSLNSFFDKKHQISLLSKEP